MALLDFFKQNRKSGSAQLAKERLQILVEDLVFLVRQVLEAEKGGVEFFLGSEVDAQFLQ